MLLIVDPQIDFITGSLPVPGAEDAMNRLADYVKQSEGVYASIIITADWHPYSHCSFTRNGGEWPVHCVHDSIGASIWPPLYDAVLNVIPDAVVVHKGDNKDTEEYSIFCNAISTAIISAVISEKEITQIDVCGLAGDICVAASMKDGSELFPDKTFVLLDQYSPRINNK